MKKLLSILFITFIFNSPLIADNMEEVNSLLKDSVGKVIALLQDSTLERENKKEEVMKIIHPVFDFPLMAKLSLGRKFWSTLNREQKSEFTSLFIKQLEDSYFNKAIMFSDQKLTFETPIKSGKKVHILTNIISPDKTITMFYKFYNKKGLWKIYDLEINEISIVKSYGSQYTQALNKGSVEELLVKMRKKELD